jgi:hypothetical protein
MKKHYPVVFGMMVFHTAYSQNNETANLAYVTNVAEVTELTPAPQVAMAARVIDFSAYANAQRAVTLTWTAESMASVNGFIIMRSTNGKTFDALRTVQSTNVSGQRTDYVETDMAPVKNASYYKLVQITPDGDSVFSETRVVRAETFENAHKLEVYPYPAEGEDANASSLDVLVVLNDVNGNTFYSRGYVTMENGVAKGISLHQALPVGKYVITAASKDGLMGNTLEIK